MMFFFVCLDQGQQDFSIFLFFARWIMTPLSFIPSYGGQRNGEKYNPRPFNTYHMGELVWGAVAFATPAPR